MNKQQLLDLLKSLKIDCDEFTIISSSALLLRDICDSAGDLDISVTQKGLEQLKQNYSLRKIEEGHYIINEYVECILEDMTNRKVKYGEYFLQEINDYLAYLKKSKREKDKARIPIVEEYIKRCGE